MTIKNYKFFVSAMVLLIFGKTERCISQTISGTRNFAYIISVYNQSCPKCRQLSTEFLNRFAQKNFYRQEFRPGQWDPANSDKSINYIIKSRIVQIDNSNLKIIFSVEDRNGTPYESEALTQIINVDCFQRDVSQAFTRILDELTYFKANGKFKKTIEVQNFNFDPKASGVDSKYIDDFTDWLTDELSSRPDIKNKYTIYRSEKNKASSNNKLGGTVISSVIDKEDEKLNLKITIELEDRHKSCKITIYTWDYETKDEQNIMNSIYKKLLELEKEK